MQILSKREVSGSRQHSLCLFVDHQYYHALFSHSVASPGSDVDLDDIHTQLRVLSMLDNPATVVAAAAARDADTIREFLTRNPQHVGLCVDLPGDNFIVP